MIEDRELDIWREQWSGVAEPPAEFQRKVQQRIKRQDRHFVLGNILTVIAFLGILIFALFMRYQSNWMGTGWATGICVLVFVAVGCRVWVLRRTWRPQTQSTRAFVELWHKKSGGSNPAASGLHLFVSRLAYFMCGTYRC